MQRYNEAVTNRLNDCNQRTVKILTLAVGLKLRDGAMWDENIAKN
ncbi:hypothetical protein [Vibrio penaeicida]|nr:hypothetical protein [Vibrio penaeicida]